MKTWNQAVERYQHVRAGRAPMTVVREKAIVAWLEPHLGGKPLNTITRGKVEDIRVAATAAGWGPTSVNHTLATIRQFLRAAEDWEWIDAAPRIRLGRKPAGRVRWLSRPEARALVAACPPLLAQMVRLSLATGLRKSTLRQIEWDWIDLEMATLHVPASRMKARLPLTLPLSAAAVAVLRERQGLHPQWVFTHGKGPVHDPSCKAFRTALAVAGVRNFRWHDLRHTWASWHVQGGTPLPELQRLGGWQTLEMVMRYAHLDTNALRLAAERVPGL